MNLYIYNVFFNFIKLILNFIQRKLKKNYSNLIIMEMEKRIFVQFIEK